MSIMFIYSDNYVGKQTSGSCEDACTHLHFILQKNVNRVKIDPCCADVCVFLTMLMRVKEVIITFFIHIPGVKYSIADIQTRIMI